MCVADQHSVNSVNIVSLRSSVEYFRSSYRIPSGPGELLLARPVSISSNRAYVNSGSSGRSSPVRRGGPSSIGSRGCKIWCELSGDQGGCGSVEMSLPFVIVAYWRAAADNIESGSVRVLPPSWSELRRIWLLS